MSYKKSDKRGEERLALNKLMIFILVMLLVTLVLLVYYRGDIWKTIKNLPGYTVNKSDKVVDYTKLSADQLSQYDCNRIGYIVYQSGFGESGSYLWIGTEKTNIYIDSTSILLNAKTLYSKLTPGSNPIIGYVLDNKLSFYSEYTDENSQYYLENKALLPDLVKLKILDKAFLLGNILCKKNAQIENLKEEIKCIDSCKVNDGECKKIGNPDEISYGKIDCKESEECFVKIAAEKTNDLNMSLKDFSFIPYMNLEIKPLAKSFLKADSMDFEPGKTQVISYSLVYPKDMPTGKGFCYMLKTNDRIIELGFNKNEDNKGKPNAYFTGFSKADKSLEIVLWDPITNEKTIKRLGINSNALNIFDGLTLISNEKLKEEVMKTTEGKFYVVDAPYRFDNNLLISTYRIDKYSGKIEVYGYYFAPSYKKYDWYAIDCYTGFFGFISIGINLDKIEPTLIGTITKNNCKLKYY